MRITGFDEAMRKLDRLSENAKALDGTHEVPASQVFSGEFMRANTSYESFSAMCDAVGIADQEQFTAYPDDAWDQHVRDHTQFASWKEMQHAGASEWAKRRLLDGVE